MRPFFTMFLAMNLAALPVKASEILVIGDSWSSPIGFQLALVLSERGHADTTVRLPSPRWGLTCGLSTAEGLEQLSTWLSQYPDSRYIHFSLGGNDILNNWSPAYAGSAAEDLLVDEIVDCMGIIVDHILAVRPQAQVVWSSYDYLRPIQLGTPPQINAVFDKLAVAATGFAQSRGPQVHTVDIVGTLQKTYGFDGVQYTSFDPPNSILPGDRSLPDPGLPSPYQAFPPHDPTHPVTEANRHMATAQYEKIYQFLLSEQAFQINAGLNDAWYNPGTPGQGFFITVFPEIEMMFLAWFTYDIERPDGGVQANLGEPGHRWLTAFGPYSGDVAGLDIEVTSGGIFDSALPQTSQVTDGTIRVAFGNCNEATVTYELFSANIAGEIPIERIALDNVSACEALNAQ